MKNKKNVLIFGVSGFVGYYLAKEFFDNGYDVFGCDIIKSPSVPEFVQFEICDLLDSKMVNQYLLRVKPDFLVNLSAISNVGQSWSMPQKTVAINVEGTLNILEVVRLAELPTKILLIGSSEEYSESDKPMNEGHKLDASNPYGISKIMQEKFAELYRTKYNLNVYYARAFNHIGPGQSEKFAIPSWCKQIKEISKGEKSATMNVGNIHVKRDFSDVRDVVCAYRLILEKGNCETIYNVGSGKTVYLKDILEHLISLSNKKIDIIIDETLVRKNESLVIWCDNTLIKKELGWYPKYDLFDTLTEIYNSYI